MEIFKRVQKMWKFLEKCEKFYENKKSVIQFEENVKKCLQQKSIWNKDLLRSHSLAKNIKRRV